ncbi:endonuclease [Parafannyhessea umbonata]|uniref:endonuclease n=1 Tax=Parafannyhessea umbonata TaxID=604330 RepID=UPI0018A6D32D|nr:endonuclease [Parafannyhessea umbonata]
MGGETMGGNPRTRNGNARRKAVARLRAQGRPCWICEAFGRNATIDYSLPARHPLSFECDELIPVSCGGSPVDPSNLAATHRRCNEWRSNRSVEWVLDQATRSRMVGYARVTTSRRWL